MFKQCCVVIPVHSATPSHKELISFKRCFEVLGKHDIYVVAPHGLNMAFYTETVPVFSVKYVPVEWQSSIMAYNKMKIDKAFYNLFKEYTYMLTYELDAYVFRDELNYWCSRGYDYIGAPFFKDVNRSAGVIKMTGVGNSGFSLRNIASCLKILESVNRLRSITKIAETYKFGFLLRGFSLLEKGLPGIYFSRVRIIRAYLQNEYTHEDTFWSVFIPRIFPRFNVADVSSALCFSFDMEPENCYALNGKQLPFGCHAWYKHPSFWNPYIPF